MNSEARRVLAVDDDQVILQSISRQLRDSGVQLDLESDPANALPRLRSTSYDLVLCDIKMKPLNGLEVLAAIRAEYPRVPVIVVSAFVDDQTVEAARELGCDDFLFKPVRKQRLIEAMEKAMSRSSRDHEP